MDLKLWDQLLRETVYWQAIDDRMSLDIYHRTAVAWGNDQKFYLQSGPERVDLTDLFEKCKLLSILKGD